MSDEKSESYAWRAFKDTALFVSCALGIVWVYLSSVLMAITVLRAIFH